VPFLQGLLARKHLRLDTTKTTTTVEARRKKFMFELEYSLVAFHGSEL
jgi:hypothetical protein